MYTLCPYNYGIPPIANEHMPPNKSPSPSEPAISIPAFSASSEETILGAYMKHKADRSPLDTAKSTINVIYAESCVKTEGIDSMSVLQCRNRGINVTLRSTKI